VAIGGKKKISAALKVKEFALHQSLGYVWYNGGLPVVINSVSLR